MSFANDNESLSGSQKKQLKPYVYFVKEQHALMGALGLNLSTAERQNAIGEQWSNMSDAQKQKYGDIRQNA